MQNTHLIKDLYPEYIKSQNSIIRKQPNKIGAKILTHLTKENIWIANKHMEIYSTSLIIRELQLETKTRQHTYCNDKTWQWRVCGIAGGHAGWSSHSGKQWARSLEVERTLLIGPSNPTTSYLPRRNGYLHSHSVYSGFSYDCKKLETIQMSSSWWMEHQTLVLPCSGILLSSKRDELLTLTTWVNLKCTVRSERSQYCVIPFIW